MSKHACPCGARYTFPDSAAGKRAKCKKCGEVFTLPEAEPEEGVFAIAQDEFSFAAEAAAHAQKADEYAKAAAVAQARGVGQTVLETSDADPTPRKVHAKGYAASVADSFLFITSLGNLVIFLVLWFMITASPLIPFGGFVSAFVSVWYSAYRYQIVAGAAGGDRNLPEIEMSREEIFDYIGDAFKWGLTWLLVLLPAIVYLVYLASTGAIGSYEAGEMIAGGWGELVALYADYPVFVILVCAASFMWPMVVLCLVLGGWETMVRPDLMIVTIIRAAGGYLATVAFWATAIGLSAFGEWGIVQMQARGGGGMGGFFVALILIGGVSIYTEIVSLRIIGLFYHHFKDRFAWDWG